MTTRMLRACAFAVAVAASLTRAYAQVPAVTQPSVQAANLTVDQALPLTCAQAWVIAGKSYAPMLQIVTMLAKVSLANRNLAFPNTREAGLDAGRGVAMDCKADPRALLFAVVDKHVRRVATDTTVSVQ